MGRYEGNNQWSLYNYRGWDDVEVYAWRPLTPPATVKK